MDELFDYRAIICEKPHKYVKLCLFSHPTRVDYATVGAMARTLREARTAAGLTQMQLAELLLQAIRAAGEDWGPTRAENMQGQIARWERGTSSPSAHWWPYLHNVLPDSAPPDDGDVHPPMTRRTFLMGTVGITALSASAASARSLGTVARFSLSPIASFEGTDLADYQERVHQTAQRYRGGRPQSVETEAVNLLGEGLSYLSSARRQRADIAVATAWVALLAGRLAFFDRNDPDTGEAHFATAAALAQTARDNPLLAAILAHRAFIAGFGGNHAGAAGWLRRADLTAPRRGQPMLRSWLHCVRAELAAIAGDPSTALKQMRAADEGLNRQGEMPQWFDWYDETRTASFAGTVELAAGRSEQAAQHLADALEQITEIKQRAVVCFDLAIAYSTTAPEQSMQYVTEGLTLVRERPYLMAINRLPTLEASLRGTPWATDLRERERELLGVG